jgi:hypothetical protein
VAGVPANQLVVPLFPFLGLSYTITPKADWPNFLCSSNCCITTRLSREETPGVRRIARVSPGGLCPSCFDLTDCTAIAKHHLAGDARKQDTLEIHTDRSQSHRSCRRSRPLWVRPCGLRPEAWFCVTHGETSMAAVEGPNSFVAVISGMSVARRWHSADSSAALVAPVGWTDLEAVAERPSYR